MTVRSKTNYKSTKDLIITTNGTGDISGADVNGTFEDSADSFQFNNGTSVIANPIFTSTETGTSGVVVAYTISPTVNQSSTAGYSGMYVNVTHTATGSGFKRPIHVAVDGSTIFGLNSDGKIEQKEMSAPSTPSSSYGYWYMDSSDSKPKVKNDAGTVFDLTEAVSGAAVAGSDTQVQFNNSSAFGASAGFTYDSTSTANAVIIGGTTSTDSGRVLAQANTTGTTNWIGAINSGSGGARLLARSATGDSGLVVGLDTPTVYYCFGVDDSTSDELVIGYSTSVSITPSSATKRIRIDATGLAFYNTTPAAQATGYTSFINLSTDRTCDANSTTVAELADILGTLIDDLKLTGIIAA